MKPQILLVGVLMFVISSCSNSFLDVPPATFLSSATFFKTESDFTQAINGAYNGLQSLYNDAYVMGEMRSDNAYLVYKYNDRGPQNVGKEQIASFTDDWQNQYTLNKYVNCYKIISRVNAILGSIDAAAINDTIKSNIKGQALFLRAFCYFELVQYFESVPMHLSVVTTEAETALPQTSTNDLYTQIIADATEAESLLPSVQSDLGRVTSGTANTLLGYVYMTLKEYDKAEAVLKAVTTSGVYSLLPDYASVFALQNKNSSEMIFEVQYLQGNYGLQSSFAYQFIPAVANTLPITGVAGDNTSIGGWDTPTQDLINSYEPGDKREAATIAMGYTDLNGTYVPGPYCIKYLHASTLYDNTDDNWPIYRYSDVLLLLAECLNEEGESNDALPYLNQVRNRAGLASSSVTDQSQLRVIIAHERRVELAFENHRWLDLVRTGQAVTVMNAYGVKQKQMFPYLLPNSYNVTTNRLIFPIPYSEMILNTQLVQNPGY
jgi:tetratricopeptide (TPR) repeat protein